MTIKIAYCFLLYDKVVHDSIWEDYFKKATEYSIYTHVKTITDDTQDWVVDNMIDTIETKWCDISLVHAYINLLKEALKDPDNKYFVLLPGECIPLYDSNYIQSTIKNTKKSSMHFRKRKLSGFYKSSQWMILNRKHAKVLVKMDGSFIEEYEVEFADCPDEYYPVNWLYAYYKDKFTEEIENKVTTYVTWFDENASGPKKLNYPQMLKYKNDIQDSGALFARKFNKKAAKNLYLKCVRM